MPRRTIYHAVTERLEILDEHGNIDPELDPHLTAEQLLALYRTMVRMRLFDQKGLNLQRQGRMGTWGSLQGQEASQAGMALAMEPQDWLTPSFREHGLMEAIGVPMRQIYAFWRGDGRGAIYPPHVNCLPQAVPVGTQFLHATGIGLALKKRGERAAVVGCGGDGATSEGDFHEAMNFAGVFQTNTVFFIQNNQWAISLPFNRQTASETIAQKAHAYGIPGIQVDGNDALAVYVASREALERARSGGGPTLIECLTYRLRDHTTADDHTRYRSADEVAEWQKRDPIDRMFAFLAGSGVWNDEREAALRTAINQEVEAEVEKFEQMSPPPPSDIFDYFYEVMPWNLKEQREQLLTEVARC
ncbi:MAG: pyruvate dehydrogenase (acetyl-transferring) E1 component subunit alpha [Candidatus Schekmanbacteria bacterium]|nr:pyruvate dehydrogenase (acetyl-transferring) E1 component subunit alpha [Candidatus Schekmanbacteria bacterium]